MESVYQALNRNIALEENIVSQVRELPINTTASYPVMDAIEFQSSLRTKALGVLPMQTYEKFTYVPPTGAVTINWTQNNDTIKIYNVTGLVASKSYILRVLVL